MPDDAAADLDNQANDAHKGDAAASIDLTKDDVSWKPKLKDANIAVFFKKQPNQAEAPEQNAQHHATSTPLKKAARNPSNLLSPASNSRSQNKRALERARERDNAKKRDAADRRWVRPA